MSQETKTAIKSAEERLEQERSEQLQNELYEFLKSELNQIDDLDERIRKLQEDKRIHEENIKNVKQGNLDAIEKRRQAVNGTWLTFSSASSTTTLNNPLRFYNTYVAGACFTTAQGKTYFF
jgi:hypothetical protein